MKSGHVLRSLGVAELPRFRGLHFVDDPLATGRTHVVSSADTRYGDMCRDLALEFARKNGWEITPEVVREAELFGQRKEAAFLAEVRARGVPQGIQEILAARRKKDIERIAREIVVAKFDLRDLVYNCHRLGLSHHDQHREWTSPPLELSDEEREVLFAMGDAPTTPQEENVATKVRQFFVEREHRSVHMFAGGDDVWHCVFLSFRDIADHSGNHWREGAHVHFVNHIFDPRHLTKKKVWRDLQERDYSVPTLHIRYKGGAGADQTAGTHPLLYVDGRTGRSKQISQR